MTKTTETIKWINFLHIYQLSNTDGYAIKEATEESYERIVRAFEENDNLKFTINITACLVSRWKELGYQYLIDRIKRLVKKGQIELVGSVSYHCLMPITPVDEIEKQIKENTKILKDNFGKDIKLKGFFMPEMAYDSKSAKIIKSFGFSWIILDEFAYKGKDKIDFEKVYLDKSSGLKVVFRSRKLSSSYIPKIIKEKRDKSESGLMVTATDGELYGLRYNDYEGEFEEALKIKNLETETISNFIKQKKTIEISIRPCNWESTLEELEDKKPYFSWFNKDNNLQVKILNFAKFSHKTINSFKDDDNYGWARWHLSRGLASCTFWWASAKDFSHVYGPYAWNPDEIERGINEMVRSIRSLHDVTSRKMKIKAEKEYTEIKKMIWEKHWTYYWRKGDWDRISNDKQK